jgi:hypothetical protein
LSGRRTRTSTFPVSQGGSFGLGLRHRGGGEDEACNQEGSGFGAGHGSKLRRHRLETIRIQPVAVALAFGRSRQPLSMERIIQSSAAPIEHS